MLATPPPPQISGDVHAGQFTMPPQPSATGPHSSPVCAHVFGTHALPPSGPVTLPPPQTFGCPPPPQICGNAQLPPHDRTPPHPFAIDPQFIPAGHAVIGLQSGAPQ